MNKDDKLIERNIELSAEFSRYLFEHPELEEKLLSKFEVILLPEYDDELREYNLTLGRSIEAKGEKVSYIKIKNMRPKIISRIENIELVSL
ncbi:MAG: hypothetical protein KKD86_08200 [Bacteroidetes bacterium]|nr:hypothetical protein [Bacteroidota bacterium]MBU1678822.1 hypothetical protein [Bacteroidota bacterium]